MLFAESSDGKDFCSASSDREGLRGLVEIESAHLRPDGRYRVQVDGGKLGKPLIPEDQFTVAASCHELCAIFNAQDLPDRPGMGRMHAGKHVTAVWLLGPLQKISGLVAREAPSPPERVGAAPVLL